MNIFISFYGRERKFVMRVNVSYSTFLLCITCWQFCCCCCCFDYIFSLKFSLVFIQFSVNSCCCYCCYVIGTFGVETATNKWMKWYTSAECVPTEPNSHIQTDSNKRMNETKRNIVYNNHFDEPKWASHSSFPLCTTLVSDDTTIECSRINDCIIFNIIYATWISKMKIA